MSQPLQVIIPDTDSFSTPPSTPLHSGITTARPSLPNQIDSSPPITRPLMAQAPSLPSDSQNHKPHNSPCFVHSHLDKGTLLADWLRNKHHLADSGEVGVAKSLQRLTSPNRTDFYDSNDEEEFVGSLTKQLADTAVGVREMSKQLGAFLPHFNMIQFLQYYPRSHTSTIEYSEYINCY